MGLRIVVKNMRGARPDWSDPRNVYCGRGRNPDLYQLPLGNPWFMKNEADRDRVCDLVKTDVQAALESKSGELFLAIDTLWGAFIAQGELTLWCWCAPLRCHADEYVLAIEYLETKMEEWAETYNA